MRHVSGFTVKLLLAFVTHATLSAAIRGHKVVKHRSRSCPSLSTPKVESSTSSLIFTPDSQPVQVTTPTATTSAQSRLVAIQVPTNITSSNSSVGSTQSGSSPITSGLLTPSNASDLPQSTGLSPSTSILSGVTSNSPQIASSTVGSTNFHKRRMLVEIIVPVVLATLVAAVIFALYRRRRIQDQKGWEGSRLPELETPSIWPFGRSRGASVARSRGKDSFAETEDWNRSDAHLRGEMDVYPKNTPSVTVTAPRDILETEISEHQEQTWEPAHFDPGHDFSRVFHSESPSYDEPALAESRPGSRATVAEPSALPYEGPEVI
ncbi:hypothetical protein B0H11DRAFT_1960613 [Mycena galericulata]|nr:hypothetical protein B0H11DRAFT_1960613 [Mycena galericulata]